MQITKASCQRPDALPVAQPTVSKQWRELEVHSNDVISPSHPFWDHELLKEGTQQCSFTALKVPVYKRLLTPPEQNAEKIPFTSIKKQHVYI